MVKIPKYDKNDWDQIREYIKNLPRERPDFSTETIFIVPLSMALLKSAEEATKLNKILIWMTAILTVLTAILILKDMESFWT